jgi:hypothetical protein
MATIDPSIAMGVRPIQIENPLNQLAAYSQIQSGQQSQQLNALKMQEAQQGIENRNALRNLDPNDPDYISKIIRIDPALGLEFQTKQAAAKTSGLQATGLELKNFDDAMKQSRNLLDMVKTPEQYIAWHEANHRNPLIGPRLEASGVTVNQSRQHIMEVLAQPGGLDKLITESKLGATKFAELNKPNIQNVNRGSVSEQIQTPGMGGAPVVTRTAQVTATPGELLTNAREQQRINLGERRDIVANTTTDAAGNVTQFNKFGEVVGKVNAAGKPSATFEKAANVKAELQKNLGTTITELKDAIKPGGLLEESTASGAGKVLDAAGNFVGYATKGSIAAASLAPIADMALKMVPRFEGPQSDKDTASYKQAAGELANSALPVATRKAAAKTIIRIMENRKNQFTTEGMINEGISSGGPALPAGFTVDK